MRELLIGQIKEIGEVLEVWFILSLEKTRLISEFPKKIKKTPRVISSTHFFWVWLALGELVNW